MPQKSKNLTRIIIFLKKGKAARFHRRGTSAIFPLQITNLVCILECLASHFSFYSKSNRHSTHTITSRMDPLLLHLTPPVHENIRLKRIITSRVTGNLTKHCSLISYSRITITLTTRHKKAGKRLQGTSSFSTEAFSTVKLRNNNRRSISPPGRRIH